MKNTQQLSHTRSTLLISREDAVKRIRLKIAKGEEIKSMNILTEEDFENAKRRERSWEDVTTQALEAMFSDRRYADEFQEWLGGIVLSVRSSLHQKVSQFESRLQECIDRLETLIEKLPDIPSEIEQDESSESVIINDQKVFIVHGRDEEVNNAVGWFVEKLGLKAIFLRSQAGASATMMEKLEENADVHFAIVLLTPDDVGGLKTDEGLLNPRGRQNVVGEFFYFMGKFGRKKVIAIQKKKVELPSDILGVFYIDWQDASEGWRILLARELKNAGFQFDLNKIL